MIGKYDGYRIQAPDGSFIGFCNKKKFEWYIKQDIVTMINDKTIRLNFEPKIKAMNKNFDDFYKQEHSVQCVVCGTSENLNKFHIVPLEFRKHFPEEMKSHACHDVLLLCRECQNDTNCVYHQYREYLLAKFGLKTNSTICKLKKSLGKSPELSDIFVKQFTEYFGHNPTTEEIDELRNRSEYGDIGNCQTVGEYIVKQYADKNELVKFEEKWRRMFVDNMEPEFLPKGW